jgi:alpha-beta hydrolase superfamily lysophospholipase
VILNTLQAQGVALLPDTVCIKSDLFNDSIFYFNCQGEKICYRKWGHPKFENNLKILLLLHGIGFHSYPYRKIMNYVDNDSILIYAMDLPGHGLSGKQRGVIESNAVILADIDSMICIIEKKNPGSEIYLMGVSMGGIYALDFAIHNTIASHLSGLILAGAALKLHSSQIISISNLLYMFTFLFDRYKPVVNLDGKRLEYSCNDREYINARRNDSLSVHYISMDYLTKVLEVQRECKKRTLLSKVTIPVLILHGGVDKISSLKGSYYLSKNLKSCKTDLIVYPESRHSLFWDKDSIRAVKDVVRWMSKK